MSWVDSVRDLQSVLQYEFKDIRSLETALTHKSHRYEANEKHVHDNEKLEFLGDAVLDLVLSDLLMKYFPQDQEGALSKKRASLVNEEALAQIAKEFKIDEFLRLGKGERLSHGLQKPRILACGFEAILGAIYIDGGFEKSFGVIKQIFEPKFSVIATAPDFALDFKTRLQEKTQVIYKSVPKYITEGEHGPDHDKQFEVVVQIDGEKVARGSGRNKKSAEQNAAQNALDILETRGVSNERTED